MADEAPERWQRLAVIGVTSGGAILAIAALSVSLVHGRVIDRLLGTFLTPLVGLLLLGLILWPMVSLPELQLKRTGRAVPGPNAVAFVRVGFNIATLIGLCLIVPAWLVAWTVGADLRESLLDALILLLVGSVAFVSLPLTAAGYALQLLRLLLASSGNGPGDKAIERR